MIGDDPADILLGPKVQENDVGGVPVDQASEKDQGKNGDPTRLKSQQRKDHN